MQMGRDPSSAVRLNAQRAKQQIIRIRPPLLKSSEVRKRRKAACNEAFVKPILLYGPGLLVPERKDCAGIKSCHSNNQHCGTITIEALKALEVNL